MRKMWLYDCIELFSRTSQTADKEWERSEGIWLSPIEFLQEFSKKKKITLAMMALP